MQTLIRVTEEGVMKGWVLQAHTECGETVGSRCAPHSAASETEELGESSGGRERRLRGALPRF